MLPYTPLHHLLFSPMYVNKPLQILICTSGNYHDEPISITNKNANHKLNQIADAFLHHNRSISRQVDDSVVQSTKYGNQFLRIARGYAPYSIQKNHKSPAILSVGAHLKNTISISNSDKIVMSQHIGDLSNSEAYQAFLKIVEDLPKLYDIHPEIVACDLHPDYLSTKFAMSLDLPIVKVQHHHAHIGSVMAEHKITEPILGISWDGTGIGSDNTIWGGEFLICENDTFERWGHLQQFPLPGGDFASKEPRRSAIGLLSNMKLDFQFDSDWSSQEIDLIQNMVKHQINSPITSSMGRLFDGIASLIGLSQINTFEGQSAMQLQYIVDQSETGFYMLNWKNNVLETDDLIMQIIQDKKNNISNQIVSAKFHNGLVKSIVEIANKSDLNHVALSGGVFQNRLLFERSVSALKSAGFNVIFNRISTPNDGGISLGQAYLASLKHQQ
jgi:hydrogenase maturation protein HypF